MKQTELANELYARRLRSEDRENRARVDAGRLRDHLLKYYSTLGQSDPLQIAIPVGGFEPHFSLRPVSLPESRSTAPHAHTSRLVVIWGGTILLAAIIGGIFVLWREIEWEPAQFEIATQKVTIDLTSWKKVEDVRKPIWS